MAVSPRSLASRLGVALVIATVLAPLWVTAGGAVPPDTRLGVSPDYTQGSDVEELIRAFERDVLDGRHIGAVRLYHAWDEVFPQPSERFLAGRDTLPVVSVSTRTRDGRWVPWSRIGSAEYGSAEHAQMRAWADALAAYGDRVIVTLDHEPDFYRNGGSGRAAEYVAAAQRFVSILRARGVDNVETAFIGVAWNFDHRSATDARAFYPGDSFVDWIGADGYNWGACRAQSPGWRTAESVFSAFVDWGTSRPNKRLLLGEFGSVEGSPGQKGEWIGELDGLLDRDGWNRIDVALWWNRRHEADRGCDFHVTTSSSSTAAFRELVGGTTPPTQASETGDPEQRAAAQEVGRRSVESRRRGATAGWDGMYSAMYGRVTGEPECGLG